MTELKHLAVLKSVVEANRGSLMNSIRLCLQRKRSALASLAIKERFTAGSIGDSYSVVWFRPSGCLGEYLFHFCPLACLFERVIEADKTDSRENKIKSKKQRR